MSRSIYNSRRWRDEVQPAQLRREPICRLHKARGIVREATEVDHRTRISEGGAPFDPENLQSLCHECHSAKTASDVTGRPMPGCDERGMPIDPKHHWHRSKRASAHAAEG